MSPSSFLQPFFSSFCTNKVLNLSFSLYFFCYSFKLLFVSNSYIILFFSIVYLEYEFESNRIKKQKDLRAIFFLFNGLIDDFWFDRLAISNLKWEIARPIGSLRTRHHHRCLHLPRPLTHRPISLFTMWTLDCSNAPKATSNLRTIS